MKDQDPPTTGRNDVRRYATQNVGDYSLKGPAFKLGKNEWNKYRKEFISSILNISYRDGNQLNLLGNSKSPGLVQVRVETIRSVVGDFEYDPSGRDNDAHAEFASRWHTKPKNGGNKAWWKNAIGADVNLKKKKDGSVVGLMWKTQDDAAISDLIAFNVQFTGCQRSWLKCLPLFVHEFIWHEGDAVLIAPALHNLIVAACPGERTLSKYNKQFKNLFSKRFGDEWFQAVITENYLFANPTGSKQSKERARADLRYRLSHRMNVNVTDVDYVVRRGYNHWVLNFKKNDPGAKKNWADCAIWLLLVAGPRYNELIHLSLFRTIDKETDKDIIQAAGSAAVGVDLTNWIVQSRISKKRDTDNSKPSEFNNQAGYSIIKPLLLVKATDFVHVRDRMLVGFREHVLRPWWIKEQKYKDNEVKGVSVDFWKGIETLKAAGKAQQHLSKAFERSLTGMDPASLNSPHPVRTLSSEFKTHQRLKLHNLRAVYAGSTYHKFITRDVSQIVWMSYVLGHDTLTDSSSAMHYGIINVYHRDILVPQVEESKWTDLINKMTGVYEVWQGKLEELTGADGKIQAATDQFDVKVQAASVGLTANKFKNRDGEILVIEKIPNVRGEPRRLAEQAKIKELVEKNVVLTRRVLRRVGVGSRKAAQYMKEINAADESKDNASDAE